MSILGMDVHSVAELKDLLEVKQYTVEQLTKAYQEHKEAWITANIVEHDAWLTDWRAFVARYEPAVKDAKEKILAAWVFTATPNELIPAEGAYDRLVKACTRSGTSVYTKGDLQDLHNRLSVARGRKVEYPNMPKSTAVDVDLAIYSASDVAVKEIEKTAANVATSPYTWALVGLGVIIALKR